MRCAVVLYKISLNGTYKEVNTSLRMSLSFVQRFPTSQRYSKRLKRTETVYTFDVKHEARNKADITQSCDAIEDLYVAMMDLALSNASPEAIFSTYIKNDYLSNVAQWDIFLKPSRVKDF